VTSPAIKESATKDAPTIAASPTAITGVNRFPGFTIRPMG
jgi:hypothetical protein